MIISVLGNQFVTSEVQIVLPVDVCKPLHTLWYYRFVFDVCLNICKLHKNTYKESGWKSSIKNYQFITDVCLNICKLLHKNTYKE